MKIQKSVYTFPDLGLCIQKHKGQLTIFAFLLIGIIIALYLSGYSSPFVDGIQEALGGNPDNLLDSIVSSFGNMITNPLIIATIGVGFIGMIFGGGVSGGNGFLFAISILIILIFANYFVLPINYILEEGSWGEAEILKTILVIFLNALLIMSVISFTRSGET